MKQDFTELVENAVIEQRTSKAGNPFYMITLTIEGGYKFSYVAMKGEENVLRAVQQAIAAEEAKK